MDRGHDSLQRQSEGERLRGPSTTQTQDHIRLTVVFVSLAQMLSKSAYDEVEPRKTCEGATLPREVGLPDLYQDVYEENNIDGTFQKMSRLVFLVRFPHRKRPL